MSDKSAIQDRLYEFPYHYIPHFERDGLPRIARVLNWGIEYLTYMGVVKCSIEALPAGSILDVGCGDGYLLNSITKPGIRKLGVDVSERPIRFAQAFASDAEFRVQDIFDMDTTYDIVVLTEVMEHIPDELIVKFVERVKTLVAPGGHLVITVPTTVVSLNKKHFRHYDEALLDSHFGSSAGWTLVADHRLYRHSLALKRILKVLHNEWWTVNSPRIWQRFWRWHMQKNTYASREDGVHLMRVYRGHREAGVE